MLILIQRLDNPVSVQLTSAIPLMFNQAHSVQLHLPLLGNPLKYLRVLNWITKPHCFSSVISYTYQQLLTTTTCTNTMGLSFQDHGNS